MTGSSSSSIGKKWISYTITALTNFAAQYNYQSIGPALLIMSTAVCTATDDSCRKGDQAAWVAGSSSAGIFLGSIIGQLSMGFLGDYFTRNTALSWTMIIATIGVLISAVGSYGSADATYSIIIVFRVLVGIGLGGVFPLSASKSSEDGSDDNGKVNSSSAAWSHFWQFPGFFVPWFLCYILTYSELDTNEKWRLMLGFGIIPCLLAVILLEIEAIFFDEETTPIVTGARLSFSITMRPSLTHTNTQPIPSTDSKASTTITHNPSMLHYDDLSSHHSHILSPSPTVSTSLSTFKDTKERTISKASTIAAQLHTPTIQWRLFGGGMTWFCFDVISFGISLLSGHIIADIALTVDDTTTSNEDIRIIAKYQMIVTSCMILVAWCGVLCVPVWGLRRLQLLAFTNLSGWALLLTCLFAYLQHTNTNALFGLYCVLFAFMCFGLGSTTYALSAALFPQDVRSTCSGICAAGGKLGAMIGCYLFSYLGESCPGGYTIVLGLCTCFAGAGAVITYYFIHAEDVLNQDFVLEHQQQQPSRFSVLSLTSSRPSSSLKEHLIDSAAQL